MRRWHPFGNLLRGLMLLALCVPALEAGAPDVCPPQRLRAYAPRKSLNKRSSITAGVVWLTTMEPLSE